LGLTRREFEGITAPLIQKALGPTRKALRDAGLTVSQIDGVVLVGGATRMPHLQRAVEAFFQREPLRNLDPEQVVALGPPFRPTRSRATARQATTGCSST